MKRKFVVGIVLIAIGAGVVALSHLGSEYLRFRLQNLVGTECESCVLNIGWLNWHVWNPGHVTVGGIYFKSGRPDLFQTEVQGGVVQIQIAVWPLWSNMIRIDSLELDHPQVSLTDGDLPFPDQKNEKPFLQFAIQQSEIHDGSLSYIRNHTGHRGVLKVHDIDLSISAFGTTPELLNEFARGVARGRVEQSGEVQLRVVARVWQSPLKIATHVAVRAQNLKDVSPFFEKSFGVELKGQILRGQGRADVDGTHLTAETQVEYQDLNFHVQPDQNRSGLAAFFTNLGIAWSVHSQNIGQPKSIQTQAIAIEREPHESIVSLILRGLKEAALKVSKAEKKDGKK